MDLRAASDGVRIDARETMYPCVLEVVMRARPLEDRGSTYFGYVLDGVAELVSQGLRVHAEPESFFALPGPATLEANGACVVFERLGYRGIPIVGRIERTGRLAYIDGCSDSILVPPPRLGDPVLNHLHFPAGTKQSVHRHPSVRLGVVARGRGVAYGPSAGGAPWELPLVTGSVFLLHAHEPHAFATPADSSLDVIAFHPDSDWGPTDAAHPMLNRTYLDPARR